MGTLQGKDWCIKKVYSEEEALKEVESLLFSDPEFAWEVRYCDICKGHHVWKNYMKDHG
jgi:hypothetical protein